MTACQAPERKGLGLPITKAVFDRTSPERMLFTTLVLRYTVARVSTCDRRWTLTPTDFSSTSESKVEWCNLAMPNLTRAGHGCRWQGKDVAAYVTGCGYNYTTVAYRLGDHQADRMAQVQTAKDAVDRLERKDIKWNDVTKGKPCAPYIGARKLTLLSIRRPISCIAHPCSIYSIGVLDRSSLNNAPFSGNVAK